MLQIKYNKKEKITLAPLTEMQKKMMTYIDRGKQEIIATGNSMKKVLQFCAYVGSELSYIPTIQQRKNTFEYIQRKVIKL
jgi:hypothetical protein